MTFHFPLLRPFKVVDAWGWPAPDVRRWAVEGLRVTVERPSVSRGKQERGHRALGVALDLPLPRGSYRLTSPYGYRIAPAGKHKGSRAFHNGLDLAAPTGTPVYAAASGKVATRFYADQASGKINGNAIILQHADGMRTAYLHMSQVLVSPGQHVNAGEKVGEVGATGQATGPHLHFIVYDASGGTVDPASLLPGSSSTSSAASAPSRSTPASSTAALQPPAQGSRRAVYGVLVALAVVGASVVGVLAWRARARVRAPAVVLSNRSSRRQRARPSF